MASIKVAKVKIIRSELAHIVEDFPLWEVPLLQAVHGQIQILGESVQSGRDAPDAQVEYERLENRYPRQKNEDGSLGMQSVAAVYGQHGAGISALRRAISEATVGAESLV